MQYSNLEQNSKDWHEHRKNYINASEVAAIMGLNPFESKKKIFKRKLFEEKVEENGAMRHGRRLEPEARKFFNETNKIQFKPMVFVKNFISASLDGWYENNRSVLEIKCPITCNTQTWNNFFLHDKIPMFYYAQVQAQLYCSEGIKVFFFVYHTYQKAKVKEILRDDVFIEKMYYECNVFYNLLQKAKTILNQLSIKQKV
ncbi:MAG: YqaJ viral recombinase family protein [Vigna little leaf phytoplasma]|nr:YqaJ viral recombinase family protein [Vigna little leaf phytoplasma]